MGYKDFANNKNLFNFYNENVVRPSVNWDTIDSEKLKYLVNSFLDKIKLIGKGKVSSDDVFNDPIDDYFKLGYSNRTDYVDFYEDTIQLKFTNSNKNLEYELSTYYSALYDNNCYEPEYYSDEITYMFGTMNHECREKLSEIATALRKLDLANKILTNFNDETVVEEVIRMLDILDKRSVRNLFDEYAAAIGRASCESVKDAFKEHFPEGIKLKDRSVIVTYDFFIKFLEENPRVQTFSDLKGHNLIDFGSEIEDARYQYDVDYEGLNEEYLSILEKIYDEMMDDDETVDIVENIKEFENILKTLKFESKDDHYSRDFKIDKKTFKRIKIYYDKIDFENKKVILEEIVSEVNKVGPIIKTYKIPFDEIVDYVMTEKLHETIKMKIRKYLL